MKDSVEDFLTAQEEGAIIDAIQEAEQKTSGEIRVHIEKQTKSAPLDRAAVVFRQLKMEETNARNGVLFYVAVESRCFAIYGDEGINTVVHEDFWEDVQRTITQHFTAGQIAKGLIEGIGMAGEQLQHFFPWQSDDVNELPNEISKG